jgi:hypothetical protein
MAQDRRQLPFRVPPDLADRVTAAAAEADCSINAWLIAAAIAALADPDSTLVAKDLPKTRAAATAQFPYVGRTMGSQVGVFAKVRPAKTEANPIPKKKAKP